MRCRFLNSKTTATGRYLPRSVIESYRAKMISAWVYAEADIILRAFEVRVSEVRASEVRAFYVE